MATTIRSRRSPAILGTAVATAALALGACVVEQPADPATGTPSTTTTTVQTGGNQTITNARLELTLNAESDMISHSGMPNYWSAGITDGTQSTYVPTNGNVTVYKQVGANRVPVGTGAASWANLRISSDGQTQATLANKLQFGQSAVFTAGTGSRNPSTGATVIQWTGTFSVNFYGGLMPFWIRDPKLTVAANGAATVTAQAQGIVGDRETQTGTTLSPWTNVTLHTFTAPANQTSYTVTPAYLGVTAPSGLTTPQVGKEWSNPSIWGSWPASWVNFQETLGLGSFWYTSGVNSDQYKVTKPVSINYGL